MVHKSNTNSTYPYFLIMKMTQYVIEIPWWSSILQEEKKS